MVDKNSNNSHISGGDGDGKPHVNVVENGAGAGTARKVTETDHVAVRDSSQDKPQTPPSPNRFSERPQRLQKHALNAGNGKGSTTARVVESKQPVELAKQHQELTEKRHANASSNEELPMFHRAIALFLEGQSLTFYTTKEVSEVVQEIGQYFHMNNMLVDYDMTTCTWHGKGVLEVCKGQSLKAGGQLKDIEDLIVIKHNTPVFSHLVAGH